METLSDDHEPEEVLVSRETRVTYLSGPFVQASGVYREGAKKAEFKFTASLANSAIILVMAIAIIADVIGHSVLATAGAFFTVLGIIVALDFAYHLGRRLWARR